MMPVESGKQIMDSSAFLLPDIKNTNREQEQVKSKTRFLSIYAPSVERRLSIVKGGQLSKKSDPNLWSVDYNTRDSSRNIKNTANSIENSRDSLDYGGMSLPLDHHTASKSIESTYDINLTARHKASSPTKNKYSVS